jgi:predicted transposase YdaD
MKNQIYDKTLKTLFESSLKEGILLKKYQKDVTLVEQIDTVSKRPKELRVDFAKKITPKSGIPYILHLEFQSTIDEKFRYRMLEYYEILARKYDIEVEQILVYVGNPRKQEIQGEIIHKNLKYRYKTLDLSTLSYKKLLKSETVDEVVLTILANFDGKKPSDMVEIIVKRLQNLAKDEEELKDAILFLQNLSDLRKFGSETSEKLKAMPVTLDYRKSTLFKEGRQEGREEGREESKEEAEKKIKIMQEKIAFQLKDIGLDLTQISKGTDLSIEYLENLFKIS